MAHQRIQSTNPMHIVLLADNSGSMAGVPARAVTEGVQNWILALQMMTRGLRPYFEFSFILFGSRSEIVAEAVSVNDLDPTTVEIDGSGNSTNLTAALEDATRVLKKTAKPHHCPPFVFLYTDGHADDSISARVAASTLKNLVLPCGRPRLVVLGFGSADDEFLCNVATSPEFYKRVPNAHDLMQLLPVIGTPTQRGGAVSVTDFDDLIRETNL